MKFAPLFLTVASAGLALGSATDTLAQTPGGGAVETLGRDIMRPVPQEQERAIPDRLNVRIEAENPDESRAPEGGLLVASVHISGSKAIPIAPLMAAVDPYLGKEASPDDLRALVRAVADQARALGYVFASAMIPPQQSDFGQLTIRLDDGAVDDVRLRGSRNKRLVRILADLKGSALRKERLERALLLAGDLPGVEIVATRYERVGGRGVLTIDAREDRARAIAAVDTYGSRAFGPARLRLEFDLAGLLDDGDRLTTLVVATPAKPREMTYVNARYTITLPDDATQLSVTGAAGRTETGIAGFPGVRIDGHSRYAALGLSHPVLRSNKASIWLTGEVAYLNVDQSVFGLTLQRDDIVTFSAGANGSLRLAGGQLSGGFAIVRGLGLLGSTRAGDMLASRHDGSGIFTKENAWINWQGAVTRTISVRLAASGQIASRPLLAAQELGVGGPGFGRAYDFSERFGDQGILGLVEVRRHFAQAAGVFDWVQIYGFADAGYVANLRDGLGGGTLASAGMGLRGGRGPVDFSVEAAFPLTSPRAASGGRDPRVNVTAGIIF